MGKGRVLLIDDDRSFLEVMRDVLEMEGYIFAGVSETHDPAGLVCKLRPNLILLDYGMPGKNADEFCQVWHHAPDLKAIPLLLLSAYPKEQLPLDRLAFSVFMAKPFDLWTLLSCIAGLMPSNINHAA